MHYGLHALTRPAIRLANQAVGTAAGVVGVVAVLGMATLLRNTDLPVTDIAFTCGFNSSQYFAEVFKKHARMTPSEFRQNLPELEKMMKINWNNPELRSVDDERRRLSKMKAL